ncbi:hypothetical protein PC116_g32732 [Phytophthora cactorum]|nr:hypothetical protein PC116_g32732 [Phytophthora cactorum]
MANAAKSSTVNGVAGRNMMTAQKRADSNEPRRFK